MSDITISKHDLRVLLFWASIGVSKTVGGSYQEAADGADGSNGTIRMLATEIEYQLPVVPMFKRG